MLNSYWAGDWLNFMSEYMQKFRLDGRTAFVVGGLGLIGKEVSAAIASAGAKTIVLDVRDSGGHEFTDAMNDEGYDTVYIHFNCAEIEMLDESFDKLQNEFGCPDVFVNCSYPRTADWGKSSFKDITLESFRRNVDIHMNSFAWLAKRVADIMVNNVNGGSIIQFGSTYGVVGQDLAIYEGTEMGENMTYAAIKGGVTNLTRLMASYYGKYNIRVNTLCPGGIFDNQDPVFVENYSGKTPLKRMGTPDEIASTVLFLASEAASYITGATIMVDGGWTAV